MRNLVLMGVLVAVAAPSAICQEAPSRPAEVYTKIALSDAEIVAGRWPGSGEEAGMTSWSARRSPQTELASTNAVFEGGAEGFLVREPGAPWGPWRSTDARLVFRSAPGQAVAATLVVPTVGEKEGAVEVRVRVPAAMLGNATRQDFAQAARDRFRRLAEAGFLGAAWFRYRAAAFETELEGGPPDATGRQPADVEESPFESADEASETYAFFSAGRAVAENLRLDRNLVPIEGGAREIADVEGIQTKAFDWEAAARSLDPARDPLATKIPENQHAAFFPNLTALARTLDALDGEAAPLLLAAVERSEDAGISAFYQRQLVFPVEEIAQNPTIGPLVTSVAITGSDPYFATGTDVAVLLACSDPETVRTSLASRQDAAAGGDVARATFDIWGTKGTGVSSPDRRISAYLAVLDGAVVVTNSRRQLQTLIEASSVRHGQLAWSPEYVFFRNRYPRTDAAETAFMILTDATIRRWCGPAWRIGDSRRTRAAARLADLTAANAEAIVRGTTRPGPYAGAGQTAGLGELAWTRSGLHSSDFGNLRFLRPIAEMEVFPVTRAERDAYTRFRDTYQQRWVNFFDPIAIRLELGAGRLGIDASVMPLVSGSEYRDLMQMVRDARFSPAACDPHDGAAFQIVFAVDASAAAIADWGRRAERLTPSLEGLALAWLKGGMSLTIDRDPVLDRFADLDRSPRELERTLPQLPIMLTAEVKDPVALAVFLAALRATIDHTAVGTLRWTKGKHRDVETMTVSGLEGWSSRSETLVIRYTVVDGLLIVTLREDVLHRAIDRALDRREGRTTSVPWLGESVALRVDEGFANLVAGWSHRQWDVRQRDLAWRALPVLSEWRRLFPDRDPVMVHEALFKVRPHDPAGGRYVVDAGKNRIVSESYGHPCESRPGPERPKVLDGLKEARGGLTFENDGVRGRVALEREPK